MPQVAYIRRRAWLQVGALLLFVLGVAACDSGAASGLTPGATGMAGTLTVVATTTQIRSLAEAVAGDRATVVSILKAGADAHTYEPVPSDVQAIGRSALVLRNGLGLDGWLDKVINGAGGQRPVVTVSDGVPVRKGDEEDPQ